MFSGQFVMRLWVWKLFMSEISVMRDYHDNKDILQAPKISDMVESLPKNFSGPHITIGELNQALSGKAYGILLLILALPNLIPMPAPGLSAVLGAPLLLITIQHMLGYEVLRLPLFIARRRIRHSDLVRGCKLLMPFLKKLELINKPKMLLLLNSAADRFVAFICALLSLTIMLPIPLVNALPALAICLFALGILQRDGLFAILGFTVALTTAIAVTSFIGPVYLFMSKFPAFG
jgi:hypothetical protein